MLLRPLSDLHNEFSRFRITPLERDGESVLVLAGDIDVKGKGVEYAIDHAGRFAAVLFVFGNHDYWKCSINNAVEKARQVVVGAGVGNVHVLENDAVEIAGTVFVGATLWTDYCGANPLEMMDAENQMRDFRKIRTGPQGVPYQKKLSPADVVAVHLKSVDRIRQQVRQARGAEKPVVVVTHHVPHTALSDPKFRNRSLGGAYASNAFDRFEETPDLWVFGHQHASVDTTVAGTRFVSNPRGYAGIERVEGFDPELVIEV